MFNKEEKAKKTARDMACMISKWDLRYNFGSIDYCINIEGVSLAQCAAAYFGKDENDNRAENDIAYDIEKATRILLTAGLFRYEDRNYFEASQLAIKYMKQWNRKFKDFTALQMAIVSMLKKRDFFSESLITTVDVLCGVAMMCQAETAKMIVAQKMKKGQKQKRKYLRKLKNL